MSVSKIKTNTDVNIKIPIKNSTAKKIAVSSIIPENYKKEDKYQDEELSNFINNKPRSSEIIYEDIGPTEEEEEYVKKLRYHTLKIAEQGEILNNAISTMMIPGAYLYDFLTDSNFGKMLLERTNATISVERVDQIFDKVFGKNFQETGVPNLQYLHVDESTLQGQLINHYIDQIGNKIFHTNAKVVDWEGGVQSFFELSEGTFGNYGVDQGVVTNILKIPDVPAYKQIYDYIHDLGFKQKDISKVMSMIDETGACSYAAVVNAIMYQFKDNPEAFERIFGYPLKNEDGTLNDALLLADIYIFANDIENGGKLFQKKNGKYRIVDTDTENQQYLSNVFGTNEELVTLFLKSKDKSLNYDTECLVRKKEGIEDYEKIFPESEEFQNIPSIKYKVKSHLLQDQSVTLSVYAGQLDNIQFFPINKSGEHNKVITMRDGGHAVYVTGVIDDGIRDGLVVSTYGEKYYVSWENLANSEFIISSASIK